MRRIAAIAVPEVAADGGYFAIAPACDCALVFLLADNERLIRTAASAIGPR